VRHFVEDELARAAGRCRKRVLDEDQRARRRRGRDARRTMTALAPLATATALPGAGGRGAAALAALAELLLTKSGTWRKDAEQEHRLSTPARRIEKDRMQRAAGRTSPRQVDPTPLQRVRTLPAPAYGDARWEILEHLLALLPVCAAALAVAFAARGESDYVGIARAALDALGPPDAPTDLALALDCRISHLLVDEFQDTSQAQVELLER
jgi:ATP-dependent helicase/nuclease subunit A